MSSSFRPDRLAAIAAAEEAHPWFVARRRMVTGLVERHRTSNTPVVVDVGCGTGRTLTEVARPGDRTLGVDLLADQSHALGGVPDLLAADARELPLEDDTAAVVLALDVLEHVVEHGRVITELARVAVPGGVVLITVPAHQWLWSHRDEDAGHVRRYTRRGLSELVAGADLDVVQLAWFACSTLPALALLRAAGRWWPGARDLEERPRDGRLAGALHRLLGAEAEAVVAGGGPPVGSSLVLVARRP